MTARTSNALLIVVLGMLAAVVWRDAAGQGPPDAEAGGALRYEAIQIESGRVFVLDTATGQSWLKYVTAGGDPQWVDMGNPARQRLPQR